MSVPAIPWLHCARTVSVSSSEEEGEGDEPAFVAGDGAQLEGKDDGAGDVEVPAEEEDNHAAGDGKRGA